MAERTLGPWQATRNNWMGELVEHEFYIYGNEHKSRTGSYATGVAIVCGNATSHGVTDANAHLIAAAPALLKACEGMLRHIDDVLDDHDLIQRRAEIVAAIALAKGR